MTSQHGMKKTAYIFKIFDYEKLVVIYESPIPQEHTGLQQLFQSGLYTLSGGHIYYNNNVIKLRYDLIECPKGGNTTIDDTFDFYLDLIALRKNEVIKGHTPLDSFLNHKFGYLVSDKNKFEPIRLLVLPYLHERAIHLNRVKLNTDYFYTTIESYEDEEQQHNQRLLRQLTAKSKSALNIVKSMHSKENDLDKMAEFNE